jgi:hypothetical protein
MAKDLFTHYPNPIEPEFKPLITLFFTTGIFSSRRTGYRSCYRSTSAPCRASGPADSQASWRPCLLSVAHFDAVAGFCSSQKWPSASVNERSFEWRRCSVQVRIFLKSGTLHESRDAAFDVELWGEQNTNTRTIVRCMPSRVNDSRGPF